MAIAMPNATDNSALGAELTRVAHALARALAEEGAEARSFCSHRATDRPRALASAAMAASSVIVVSNALRLRRVGAAG